MFQGSFRGVPRDLGDSRELLGVSRQFLRCLKEVSRVFKKSVKCVLRKFQKSFKGVSVTVKNCGHPSFICAERFTVALLAVILKKIILILNLF